MHALIALFLWVVPAISTPTTTITETIAIWPTVGVAPSDSSLDSTIPIPCEGSCLLILPSYFFCYVFTHYLNGQPVNTTQCKPYLCDNERFELLSGCLNCVVANGDERPFGYSTNTSMTVEPTANPLSPAAKVQNPNGLLNLTQSNEILKNVTDGCAAINKPIRGASTITATPTTTGPYTTSWTSGATVNLTVWPGLTQFTTNFTQLIFTETQTLPPPSSSSTSGMSGGDAQGHPTSSSPASAATSGAAVAHFRQPCGLVGLGLMSYVLSYL